MVLFPGGTGPLKRGNSKPTKAVVAQAHSGTTAATWPATPQPATSHESGTPQRCDLLLSKIMTGATPVGKPAPAPAPDAAQQPQPRRLLCGGAAPGKEPLC